jgi:predicted metal-dependent hydrolase
MAIMEPGSIPTERDHLGDEERALLAAFERAFEEDRFAAAHDVLEELWGAANDAHKTLYQGVANIVAAFQAVELGHARGATEIARHSHRMLRPFPRRALRLDLDQLLALMDRTVSDGVDRLQLEHDAAPDD